MWECSFKRRAPGVIDRGSWWWVSDNNDGRTEKWRRSRARSFQSRGAVMYMARLEILRCVVTEGRERLRRRIVWGGVAWWRWVHRDNWSVTAQPRGWHLRNNSVQCNCNLIMRFLKMIRGAYSNRKALRALSKVPWSSDTDKGLGTTICTFCPISDSPWSLCCSDAMQRLIDLWLVH